MSLLLLPHLSPLELRSIQVSEMERGQQAPGRIQACHDLHIHNLSHAVSRVRFCVHTIQIQRRLPYPPRRRFDLEAS